MMLAQHDFRKCWPGRCWPNITLGNVGWADVALTASPNGKRFLPLLAVGILGAERHCL